MIDKEKLKATVDQALEGTTLFLVDLRVTPNNEITVTVDAPEGVDIEQCVALTHTIEEAFDREVEDYELEVGSAGLTAPFTVPQQYFMNVGNDVEVLTRDGRKLHGVLTAVNDDCTQVTVSIPTKVKEPGQKRPQVVDVPNVIDVANIKRINCDIKF